jgi:hypothetical protein
MVDFVLTYCEKSDNAVLHQFGADAARRAGDVERGIAILEKQGLLHEAALFARESQLPQRADELLDKLKKKKLDAKLKRLGGDPDDPIWGPGTGEREQPPRKEEILGDIEMPKFDEGEGEAETAGKMSMEPGKTQTDGEIDEKSEEVQAVGLEGEAETAEKTSMEPGKTQTDGETDEKSEEVQAVGLEGDREQEDEDNEEEPDQDVILDG